MSKHKWWHCVWGKDVESEIQSESGNAKMSVFWWKCNKCGEQLTEKEGMMTFSYHIISDNK